MKKNNKTEETIPSKGKIIFAWIFLIILIASTLGLVYLKNFSTQEDDFETGNQDNQENTISDTITTALNEIVNNFNNSTTITEYKNEGLSLTATLDKATIIISYTTSTTNGNITYIYDKMTANLYTTFQNTESEINNKVFKNMVIACQNRIGVTEDITSQLEEFITTSQETTGLKKETTETTTKYYLSIVNPIVSTPTTSETIKKDDTINDQDTNTNMQTSEVAKEEVTSPNIESE